MAEPFSWKEFEAIVARLQKSFAKGGQVECDEKIQGRHSGRKRQIDVTVRVNIGGETLLLIIECKKWRRKIDVKAVEGFAGVQEDVGAHKAIMVSLNGFSAGARRLAEAKNISLYRYEDTLKQGWPNGIETFVLMEIWEVTPTTAYLVLRDGTREAFPENEEITMVTTNDGEAGSLGTGLRKMWDGMTEVEKEQFKEGWVCECDSDLIQKAGHLKTIVLLGFGVW